MNKGMATIGESGVRPITGEGDVDLLRVYLVRHGETPWSRSGQHTGKTDIALTQHGEDQARALAPLLNVIKFDHVLTSPALRARQTSELAGYAGQAFVDSDFAEWDYGDYEGKRSSEIRTGRPGWNVFRNGCPGGESARDVTSRTDRAGVLLRALSGNILIFSHGHFSRSLAVRWIGLPIIEAQHFRMDPASISILAFDPAHPELAVIAQWNSTPAMTTHQTNRTMINA